MIPIGIPYIKENLGKKDPQYGGILTDAATLPVGTTFYVCNGAWTGKVVEVDGKKAIQPKGCPPCVLYQEGDEHNILALSNIKTPD